MQRFAFELRKLRAEAGGTTYREMAQRAGYSITTLSQAAGGEQLPTLAVVLAYVAACGGDAVEWEARWKQVVDEAAAAGSEEGEGEGAEPPYKGLARFRTGDRDRFFGRDRLTADLLELVRRQRFAALFGPSGSGKSSLLRAGLIPALQHTSEGDLRPAGIRILTPGEHPARKHGRLLGSPADTGPGHGGAGADTFVIVDQFEEVFTLCQDPAERSRFIGLLLAARRPENRLRVLIAVRADFYDRCAQLPALADALGNAHLLAGPMNAAELREAVVKPATAAGLTVERALTARLVEEVTGAPGGLPLLSHVLLETWRRRRGKTLTMTGYEAAGGLVGAIAKTAEEIHGRFTDDQAATARRLLLRLVTPGDGTPDTRRPAQHAELQDVGGQQTAQVLEALTRARLLTQDDDTVDLAHEALLTAWPRLRNWIEHDRERLRAHRKLTEAAHAWEELGHDAGALYRGSRLATVQEHFGPEPCADLTALENAFLTTSLQAHDSEQRAAARATRRLRALTASLSILLVLAVTASLIAWQQSRTSDQQRRSADTARQVALSRQLAAQSAALITTNSDLASLLAVQAYRTSPTTQATESLYAAAAMPLKHRLTGQRGAAVTSVAFSPDGRTLATTGDSEERLWLWDAHTGRLRRSFGWPGRQNDAAALVTFTPDGRTLTTASSLGHGVDLWNVATGHTRKNLLADPETSVSQDPEATTEALSPNGRILAVASQDGTLRLWDTATGRLRRSLATPSGTAAGVTSLAFSPDGRTLATGGDDRTIRLWDTGTGRPRATLPPLSGIVTSVAFNTDGRILAAGGQDGTLRLWDTATGRLRRALATGSDAAGSEATVRLTSLAFSPDGRTLATGGDDRTIRLWDTSTGRLTKSLAGHAHGVRSVAFSPDGSMLATGDEDGNVRLWGMTAGASRSVLGGPLMKADVMAFSPDGSELATTSTGIKPVRVWDTAAGRLRESLGPGTVSLVTSVAFGPDGRTLATANSSGFGADVWDTGVGRLRVSLGKDAVPSVTSVAFSPDGHTVAMGSTAIGVQLWNTGTGRVLRSLAGDTAAVTSVAFSPDGHTLAVGGEDGSVRLWDPGTGRARESLAGNNSAVTSVMFSPDGRTLAAGGSKDRTIQVWDTATGHHRASLPGYTGEAGSMAFSPDSRILAVGAIDGTVRLWDTAAGSALATLTGHTSTVLALVFSADGRTLLTGSADQTLRRWDVALPVPAAAIDQICQAIGRDLTANERSTYLPDQPPHTTCQA
ncbi:hypothetical protein OG568_57700 (plasmid) [Streptomyces sp. NBC_01450]|uniref:nSTAND1 domain-containing NTPase n=1 Tax=Streptomyces sp. NBC_01450 TaxID=2903871 RepID=UPI002E2EE7C7|nr:helix-turn-helix domain-containing protein [Streptomyces sp. NBC_01450]